MISKGCKTMAIKTKMTMAAFAATIFSAGTTSAPAAELNPRSNTPNLEYRDVLKIRLPYGMCEFEQVVPAFVVDKLSERRDWNRLVEYMLVNCPDLGLPLADTATASISEVDVDESGDGSGGSTGPDGSGGPGDSGGGDTDSGGDDDDGNNGHGNDADGHDESNPGKS